MVQERMAGVVRAKSTEQELGGGTG